MFYAKNGYAKKAIPHTIEKKKKDSAIIYTLLAYLSFLTAKAQTEQQKEIQEDIFHSVFSLKQSMALK